MHPLHDYVAKQLASHLTARGVVVWFDPRREFAPFIDELRGGPRARGALTAVTVGPIAAQLAEYDGSMFELRALAEPLVGGDVPDKLVVYLPGIDSEPTTSVLLELELAGERYQPGLKRLARNVLAQRYTDGVIDELTSRPNIGWAELAQAASDTSSAEAPSTLKTILRKAKNGDELVAAWLATDQHDPAIADKGGVGELVKLVRSRLGLELPDDATLAKLRAITLRYVLGSEFRSDLRGAAPASLDSIPVPRNGKLDAVRDCAHRLRSEYAEVYADLADRVEAELGLTNARFVAADLGAIDTFRFEERALLAWCDELIARGQYAEALAVADERAHTWPTASPRRSSRRSGRARRPAPDAGLERGRRRQAAPVAYFLVDAMRFEMGVELAERLPKTSEVARARRGRRAAEHHADRHVGAVSRARPRASASSSRAASSAPASTTRSCPTWRRGRSTRGARARSSST
jgi:hypothetical protein